ncbi:carboxylic acid reductase [Streptomyces sp. 1331.2]|uniref:carboxylic acid reductase n=1 Tax=Streptomyces sp. 1331.2 TaxID=1938835 RepID=UPI000BC68E70|nr:carboxylic acid reductase [Streptomyces sp. 1331.2]SOB81244.1 fatty acid CoA ligase FadD9 [Streptomyces sp. 1331.2]
MKNNARVVSTRAELEANRKARIAGLVAAEPELAGHLPLREVHDATAEDGLRLAEIVRRTLAGYADRPALGERAREFVTVDGRTELRLLPRFDTVTYGELWQRLRAIAADWYHHPEHPLRAGDFVATLGFAGADYTAVDLACSQVGAVAVPLHNNASVEHIAHLVAEAAPRVFATSVARLGPVLDALDADSPVRRLIVFDHHPELDEHREAVAAASRRLAAAGSPLTLELLSEVIGRGRELPDPPALPAEDGTAEGTADGTGAAGALSSLIYTSGSTGSPKGVMFSESTVSLMWRPRWESEHQYPTITANFLPQSHLVARRLVAKTLAQGGIAYFMATSDLSTFLEDLALIRPTELALVPRVCEMVFQSYQSRLEQLAPHGELPEAEHAGLLAHFREEVFGGRLVLAPCGSAPLARELVDFLEACLEIPFLNSYGTTETGLVMLDQRVQRALVLDYKLVDVPELGYFTTDSPHPRGELLLKSRLLTSGYYRRPEVTAEVFDEDGYYRTGDIMAELEPDRLVYVDRRNNVLKLSQGEFVALAKLEAAYVASSLVHQVFVYGNSSQAFLLAVVVPTPEALEQTPDEGTLKAAISASLQRIARDAGLQPYEVPRDLLIETEPFSQDNGLLSDSTKHLRPRLKAHYGPRLEQRYAELAESRANELHELRQDTGRPVLETVARAVQALLGTGERELDPTTRFTDLGGDSLSALSLSGLLREVLDVEVPVGTLIGPANSLRRIADHIEQARDQAAGAAAGPGDSPRPARRPAFADVHGDHPATVRAADLTLDRFIDPATLAAAPSLPRPTGAPATVLLTGANGYLGRFLCLEWLERLAPAGGTLICLVRGTDDTDARQRLDRAMDSGDSELKRRFAELTADGTLQVLAGDIGTADLGLAGADWERLTATVDLIVHPAALVNHVLPYRELFGPNVAGTAELVRLALTTRLKPVSYLSSVAVAAHGALDEDGDIRATDPERPIDGSHANGYATSKWAGEVLLREAHDLCGLPVTVFRSDMILAHGRYTGQVNVTDTFTRLVLSLIATGIAPQSFYRATDPEQPVRAHYDGLPADFVAAAVTALGGGEAGHRTYNAVNPHDDGVSLDTVVDWLIAAGTPIHRIADHGEWHERFATALRGLPERQRQHSLLPLLHAYRAPATPVAGSAVPAERFRRAVRGAGIGAQGDIPGLSRPLIEKYLTDLQHLQLI